MGPPAATADTVWSVVLDPATGGGCSTLDLLKRIAYDDASAPSPFVAPAVRAEMASIALAKQHQHELKRSDQLTKGPARAVATMNTLGERLGRPRPHYVPGTPIERKLHAGRLLRTDGRDGSLTSSRSAPTLPAAQTAGERDALDQAVQQQQQVQPSAVAAKATAAVSPYKEDPQTTALRDQRQQLEQQLLHVTQKLCRKYTKHLFLPDGLDGSPDKTSELADKWANSDAMSERERYKLYMGSRFTTQQKRDFYKRDLEPREPENDRHRRETAHTKYGDALAKSKHSLRANF